MASENGDKTEKPSEQKLRKAREQGQIARSRDLPMALGILIAFKLIVMAAPGWLEDFRLLFAIAFTPEAPSPATASATLMLLARMVLPLLALPAAVLLASLYPGGLVFTPAKWLPDFSRLNPLPNLGRLVSAKHFGDLGLSILKVLALLALLAHLTWSLADSFVELQGQSLSDAVLHGSGLMIDALLTLAALLMMFALVDAPLQLMLFLRGQRMSKQEIKDEYKQQEGRPEVRQRIRQLQRALSQRNVRKAVPDADVVVVNPEHYAVALRYDDKRAEAPFVVAKGIDEMAFYIRQVASEHEVPVLTLPPLARALYNSSQVQQQIPASLYQAVAQVLGYVMQLEAFRGGRRNTAPTPLADLPVPAHLSDPSDPVPA